jgi:ribosomal protein L22
VTVADEKDKQAKPAGADKPKPRSRAKAGEKKPAEKPATAKSGTARQKKDAAPKEGARKPAAKAKAEPKTETKAEPKTETKAAPKTEAKAEAKAEAKPAAKGRAKRPARTRGAAKEEAKPAATPRRRASDDGPVRPVVRAQAKYVRSSARKARLVMDHVRGKTVTEAQAVLRHSPRGIARDLERLLASAVANAENNHELVSDDLYVKEIYADEGPTLRRFRPRAQGRATRIRKRTSHLTVALSTKE